MKVIVFEKLRKMIIEKLSDNEEYLFFYFKNCKYDKYYPHFDFILK